jgi:hypothetical protein
MFRSFTQPLRKDNRMWWITAFAVLGFFLCMGTVIYLKYFLMPVPDPLPDVPVFSFNTSTPLPNIDSLSPANGNFASATPEVVFPALSPTTLPTSTSFSFYNWLLSTGVRPTNIPAIRPSNTPTPIRVFLAPATLTNTPIVIPTITLTSPVSSNPNVCKNILYPARAGSRWTYYVSSPVRSGIVNMSVTSVSGQQAAVNAVDLDGDTSVSTNVLCDQDVILNFPLLSAQKLIGNMINGTMNVEYVGGVLAPNEAAFTSSNWALSWMIQYRISGNGTIHFRGRDFNVAIAPSPVQMTCQTLGSGEAAFETITVPAGTFNALKVVCRGEGQQVTATVNGSQVVGSISAQATQWFAPNIGMLRSQSDYALLNVFGISIPLSPGDISGYLELQNYTIGP